MRRYNSNFCTHKFVISHALNSVRSQLLRTVVDPAPTVECQPIIRPNVPKKLHGNKETNTRKISHRAGKFNAGVREENCRQKPALCALT